MRVGDDRRKIVKRNPADLRSLLGDCQEPAIDGEMPPVRRDLNDSSNHSVLRPLRYCKSSLAGCGLRRPHAMAWLIFG